jgi:hypothetical protein
VTVQLTHPLPTRTLADVFRRAAEVITLNGLAKGAFVAPPAVPDSQQQLHCSDERLRSVDMVGAIRIACGQLPTTSGGLLAMAAVEFASLRVPGQAPWTDGVPDHIEHLADWTDLTAVDAVDVAVKFLDLAGIAAAESRVSA